MAITILQQPTLTLTVGDTLSLTTKVLETDAKVQWLHDGASILNATSSTYVKKNLTLDDTGRYSAKWTRSTGKAEVKYSGNTFLVVTTPAATGSITPVPTGSTQPTGSNNTGSNTTGSIASTGSLSGSIVGLGSAFIAGTSYTLTFAPSNFNADEAHIIWESNAADVGLGQTYTFTPKAGGTYWVQAEVNHVDGRRLTMDGTINVNETVSNYIELYNPNITTDATIKRWYKLDNDFSDTKGNAALTKTGSAVIDKTSFIFPNRANAGCLAIGGITDYVTVSVPAIVTASNITIECMMRFKQFNADGAGNASIFRLEKNWNSYIGFVQNIWNGPSVQSGKGEVLSVSQVKSLFTLNQWNHVRLVIDNAGYSVLLNGTKVGSLASPNAVADFLNATLTLTLGQESGYVDELIIKYS